MGVVYRPELNSMGIIVCKEILCAEQEVEQTPCQEIVLSKYHPVGVAGLQPDEVDCDPDLPLQSGGVVTHVYPEDPDCVTVGNPTVCTRASSLRTGSDASSILSGLSSISRICHFKEKIKIWFLDLKSP